MGIKILQSGKMRKDVPALFAFMVISAIFGAVSYSAVLNDPCVPDGEQIVWRWTDPDN